MALFDGITGPIDAEGMSLEQWLFGPSLMSPLRKPAIGFSGDVGGVPAGSVAPGFGLSNTTGSMMPLPLSAGSGQRLNQGGIFGSMGDVGGRPAGSLSPWQGGIFGDMGDIGGRPADSLSPWLENPNARAENKSIFDAILALAGGRLTERTKRTGGTL